MRKRLRLPIVAILTLLLAGFFAPSVFADTSRIAINIGDSYDVGFSGDANRYQLPNNAAYVPSTRVPDVNECGRLVRPALTQAAQPKGYAVEEWGCAGATTEDIMSRSQWNEGRQIDRVHSDAALVHVQIGGNDAKFGDVVSCVLLENCTATSQQIVEANNVLASQLPGKLDALYQAIKLRAPEATYLAAGYPPILPRSASEIALCGLYMSPSELQIARGFLANLNTVIRDAAGRNGFTYVDPDQPGTPFNARDLIGLSTSACSPSAGASAWNLRLINPDGLSGITGFSFHLTRLGVDRMAQVTAPYVPT